MKAIHCVRYGEPEDLVFVELPSPQPGPNEVVIAVEAVGLGFADGLNVRGAYQVKRPLPFIPGSEVAGSVIACGDGVSSHLVGQRVMALANGGLAEEVVVAADQSIALPGEVQLGRRGVFLDQLLDRDLRPRVLRRFETGRGDPRPRCVGRSRARGHRSRQGARRRGRRGGVVCGEARGL